MVICSTLAILKWFRILFNFYEPICNVAIWSDAAHLTTDLFAFLIAIATSFLASKKSTKTFTWGFKRLESVAALFSIGSLVTVTIYLLFESISRFVSLYAHADNDDDGEYAIDGSLMTLTAMMGVVVNIALACILRENHVHLPGAGCGDACGHDHSIQISSINIPPPKKNLTEDDDIEMIVCRPCQPCTPSCTPCTIPKGDDEETVDQPPAINKKWGLPMPTLPVIKQSSSKHNYQLVEEARDDEEKELQMLFPKMTATAPKPSKTPTNVNLDAAYLHALTDLAQSVIVLITGCVIWWKPNWYLLDPFLTFCFSLLVLWGSKDIIIRSFSVLLEVIPPNIDYDEILNSISAHPKVTNVCGLRIWSVSDGQVGLTCHINCASSNTNKNSNTALLRSVMATLKQRFSIDSQYVTVQIYQNDADICPSCGYDTPVNN